MLKIRLLLFAFICFALILSLQQKSLCEDKIRVLFIGNSLTYANNLPKMISDLVASRHHALEYSMCAPGGYRFSQHASDPVTLGKIRQGNWDFVVLQEQSQLPDLSREQVARDVYPYAKQLCDYIRLYNNKAKIIFYSTMAHKNGDLDNLNVSSDLSTYAGTQKRIDESYSEMASDNRALIAPVGKAWAMFRKMNPSIELYADNTHPNVAGSYLAACVFFSTFFNESAIGLPHPQPLDDQTALYLQQISDWAAYGM